MSSRPQPSPVSFSKQRKVSLPVDLAEKLPCNLDAERSVLGAILLDNTALGAPTEYLLAQDFFIPQHQIIYLKMMEVYMDCQAIDLVTLTERLHAEGKLEQVGGAGYLASLTDGVPRVSNAKHYANIVKEKSACGRSSTKRTRFRRRHSKAMAKPTRYSPELPFR